MKPSKNLDYKPFTKELITASYLSWLNDPDTNRYSLRRFYHSTYEDAEKFVQGLKPNEFMFAIYNRQSKHIGNIHLGPIDSYNLNCEIRILIGDSNVRGCGVGAEAIYSAEKFLFFDKGMYRVGADSFNPAFEAVVVKKLGWRIEGAMKERMLQGNERYDYKIYGLLKKDFKILSEYE